MSGLAMRALPIAGAFGVAGCGLSEIRWMEEGRLRHDRAVQLKRRTEFTVSSFPVQKRGIYRSLEFRYAPPAIKVTGARGLNELPERCGARTKCKTPQTEFDQRAGVFLPSSAKPCGWKESR